MFGKSSSSSSFLRALNFPEYPLVTIKQKKKIDYSDHLLVNDAIIKKARKLRDGLIAGSSVNLEKVGICSETYLSVILKEQLRVTLLK